MQRKSTLKAVLSLDEAQDEGGGSMRGLSRQTSTASNISRKEIPGIPLDGVIKIFVRSVSSDYRCPWSKTDQQTCSGSGWAFAFDGVPSGRVILTNSHVVRDGVLVRVQR
jgi:hypothetical protein